jgi:Protein of unknown function (DUF4239)
MDLYWIYDIPSWQLFGIVMIITLIFSLGGLLLIRSWVRKLVGEPPAENELVSYFLTGLGVFYGITLGLIAAGTWQNFSDIDGKVGEEAASLAALYRDVSYYPAPINDSLKSHLKEYTRLVINDVWKEQQRGMIPIKDTKQISKFQKLLYGFNPETNQYISIHQEALSQFNNLIQFRRQRLQSVTSGMPGTLWWVLIFGAVINIIIMWFFVTEHLKFHLLLTAMYSMLVSSLLFLIVAMDNPFRGEFSVNSDAFALVYEQLMK